MSLCALVLTYNERLHIKRCIESLSDVVDRIVIVDSGSSDGTQEIAERMGADVFQKSWVNYATQFQWGIDNAGIREDWILRIDADERLNKKLARQLPGLLLEAEPSTTGFLVNRELVFLGRKIRWGGRQPQMNLRIWRRGSGRIEDRWMDEHVVLKYGEIAIAPGSIIDENLNDIGWWISKHNNYATREMIDIINTESGFLDGFVGGGEDIGLAAGEQAGAQRARKEGFYQRLPLFLRPAFYFFFRFFFQLGLLDGREGMIYHVLQGFWYRFLVDVKVLEARRLTAGLDDPKAIRTILSKAYGLNFEPGLKDLARSSAPDIS